MYLVISPLSLCLFGGWLGLPHVWTLYSDLLDVEPMVDGECCLLSV